LFLLNSPGTVADLDRYVAQVKRRQRVEYSLLLSLPHVVVVGGGLAAPPVVAAALALDKDPLVLG